MLSLALAIVLVAGGPGDPGARAAFVEALGALEPLPRASELEERAARLASLPDATAAWIEIRAADAEPEPLSGAQRDLLDRTASKLPREEILAFVGEAAAAHPDVAWRGAALALLGRHATSEDLALIVGLVRTPDGEIAPEGLEGPLVQELEAVLVEIARRDVRLQGWMGWFTEHAAALRPALIRALGASDDPETLRCLVTALQDRDLAAIAMRQIARLAVRAGPAWRPSLCAEVRPFLAWSDAATRRHAIRALVALDDQGSLPMLLQIVETESGDRHDAEFAALRDLSGKNIPAEPARWRRWFDEERRWLEEESAAVVGKLASEKDADVVAALRALSEHGLERDRIAESIATVLRVHPRAAVRGQACLALERLKSKASLEALVAALGDTDAAVAANALTALRAITGLSLPLNPKSWRDALQ